MFKGDSREQLVKALVAAAVVIALGVVIAVLLVS